MSVLDLLRTSRLKILWFETLQPSDVIVITQSIRHFGAWRAPSRAGEAFTWGAQPHAPDWLRGDPALHHVVHIVVAKVEVVAVADVEGDYRVPQLRDVLAEIASPREELEEDAMLWSGSLCDGFAKDLAKAGATRCRRAARHWRT